MFGKNGYTLVAIGSVTSSLSAGPIRTIAASGIGDFKSMLGINAAIAPLQKNATADDVAKTAAYLLSDWSECVTGENVHVDGGYHLVAGPTDALAKLSEIVK